MVIGREQGDRRRSRPPASTRDQSGLWTEWQALQLTAVLK